MGKSAVLGGGRIVKRKATLEGTVAYNRATYTFRATLQDNADPGAGFDTFSINIPATTGAVYSNGSNTILGDGKVQVNGQACATTTICHRPPGNPTNTQQINVSVNAIPAHVAHLDNIVRCVSA